MTLSGRALLIVYLFGLVFLAGCDVLLGGQEEDVRQAIREQVDQREQLWQDQEINDYQLVYSQLADRKRIDSVIVFVSGGDVDSTWTSSTAGREDIVVEDVESFFQVIRDRVGDDDVDTWNANFNDSLGYPSQYQAVFVDGEEEEVKVLDLSGVQ